MKKLIILLAIIILSTPAFAIKEINEAFGLELGVLFIPEQMATGRGEMTTGVPVYFFQAHPPYHALTKYYVKITPITQLIYSIVGEHDYDMGGRCTTEMETLAGLIGKKYGGITKNDFMLTYYKISQGDRSIDIDCGFIDDRLRITYLDSALETKAKSEQVDKLSKEGSASGL